ncbi:MAG: AAA family ATPase, partial [Terriglobales bacterium]
RFEIDVALDGEADYRYELVIDGNEEQRPKVRRETLDYGGKPLFGFEDGRMSLYNDSQHPTPSVNFHADWYKSGLAIVASRPDNRKLTKFKDWLEKLRPVQINPWEMSEQSEQEARYPSRNLENVADWFRHLQQESGEIVREVIEDLREAIPGFRDLNAKKAGLDYREVMATLAEPGGGRGIEVALTELSEGQRCLIALYLLLHAQTDAGGLLIVDEPENFIALREIQPWLMRAFERVEDKSGQLIVASHHPEMLNQLAARGALLLIREDGGPAQVKPFPESAMAPSEVVARGWEDA